MRQLFHVDASLKKKYGHCDGYGADFFDKITFKGGDVMESEKEMFVIVVGEDGLRELLNQGIPHRNITKRLMELIDRLGDGHCDCYGAVGISIQMENLIKGVNK